MENKKIRRKRGAVVVATFVTVLAIGTAANPAGACEQPHNPAPPVVSTAGTVRVTQDAVGSFTAILEWPAVAGATEYRIYKTGSIRPYWRLFWIAPRTSNRHSVADKPGAIAIYRVAALVKNREIDLGSFTYIPKR